MALHKVKITVEIEFITHKGAEAEKVAVLMVKWMNQDISKGMTGAVILPSIKEMKVTPA